MYNRYIPQSDGSYQRSRMPEQAKQPPQRQQRQERQAQRPPCPPPAQPAPPPCPPPRPCREQAKPQQPQKVGSFLRNLLPRDFDTEDLLVILLFLLMSRDCEDQNSALLTLALYLFM